MKAMRVRASAAIAAMMFAVVPALINEASLAQSDGRDSTVAIRAGRVMPVSSNHPWVIEDGVVLIENGVVSAVGAAGDVSIPHGVPTVHWPDSTIVPGFVSASSSVVGSHGGDESIGADYRAVDGFDTYQDFRETLAGGVTTVHLSPGWHRLLSGQGSVVRLAGREDERVLVGRSDLTVTLGPAVFNPPDLMEMLTTPSPDHAIRPSVRQRPSSRLGQYVALRDAIASALGDEHVDALVMPVSHRAALAEAWRNGAPVRVQAHDSVDIDIALRFFEEQGRDGYLVGGWGAADAATVLRGSGVPLVYTIGDSLRSPTWNLGTNPDAMDPDVSSLGALDGVRLALSVGGSNSLRELRLAASMAQRAGLSERQVLEAITRVPAEILGVGDRVGSLEAGKDADLVVLTGDPLATSSHVERVLVRGRVVYRAHEEARATVVKAGTIWLGPDEWLNDGSILIENGRITQVGRRVAVPPRARIIDAGADSFVAPGFIDGHNHLNLSGDPGPLEPAHSLASLVGAQDVDDLRVARSGVTTVLAAPYRFHNRGSQVSAIKTAGMSRDERIVRPTAAVAFDVRGQDPREIERRLKPALDAGKKYLEKWQKYEKDLAEWEKKKAEGTLEKDAAPKVEEVTTDEPKEDPITGTWSLRATGAMLPEPQEGEISLKLTGNQIEGRMTSPPEATEVEHRILGTLNGTRITGTIEINAPVDLPATPFWEGDITEPDHIVGVAGLRGMVQVDVELRRISKTATDFKVSRRKRRTTGEDGRPLPPPIDESLEPVRALLEKKIPAMVSVGDAAEIEAVLDVLVDGWELPVVLLNAEGAAVHSDRLGAKSVGVVLPRTVVREEKRREYHQGADLAGRDIGVAFQSDAEDGARSLRNVALFAVERGMSAEQVLEAMTVGAAKMFKIDDRVGSIAAGKDGDLVIFSGYPFDPGTVVERVLVNGEDIDR